ncbi:hypothetical protein [Stieleria marina]|uniref:Uncharacterized protein n=1 Tax=Stieleria marina TaxID=1930275 RepID=A0A517NQ16_9BACT|nr:hypothetical protein K239x_11560 [Planctomycetes bacterium K23_9]
MRFPSLTRCLTLAVFALSIDSRHACGQEAESLGEAKPASWVKTLAGRNGEIELHRISLSGMAKNLNDEPVAGATIIVGIADWNRISGTDQAGEKQEFQFEIARVKTDDAGSFLVEDLIVPAFKRVGNNPDSIPLRTPLQLIGIAGNHGLTWCREFQFRPGKRPGKTFEDEEGKVFFSGEAIAVKLVFGPAIALHGQITDQNGNPIAGVTVRAGLVNRSNDGPDDLPRSTSFSFGKDGPLANLGYPTMPLIPEDLRMTQTDAKGEYRFGSIPDGIGMSMSFSHPSFLSHVSKQVATTPGPGRRVLIGPDGQLDVSVNLGNTLAVGATDPVTGKLVPGTKFELMGARTIQHNSVGTADDSGLANIRIFQGNYQLRIVPPAGDQYWVTTNVLLVDDEQKAGDKLTWDLLPAKKVQLKAMRGDVPAAGVAFEYTSDQVTWDPVPTQGSYTEYAKTEADGIIAAVLPLDAVAIRIADDDGSIQQISDSTELVFASSTQRDETVAKGPTPDPRYTERTLRGIYRYRANNSLEKDITQAEFRDAINKLVHLDANEAERALREFFGEIPTSEITLTQDVGRRRVDRTFLYETGKVIDRHLDDGVNEIRCGAFNRQCNVYMSGKSRIHLPSVFSILSRPIPPGTEEMTRENDRLVYSKEIQGGSFRIEQDATSGLVHLREYLHANGGESRWQLAPFQVGALSIPRVIVSGDYRDGKLSRAKVFFIDDVQLLDSIPPETFGMSVPAGTSVFDERAIERDQVSRRGRHTSITTDCLDLIARIGEVKTPRDAAEPVMRYGDPAPQLQIQSWIRGGRTIDAPDLKGKRLLLVFMPADENDFRSALPALRRMNEAFAGKDDTHVIAIFSPPLRASSVAKLAVLRDLDCVVALDQPSGDRLHGGATRSSYPGYSKQITVVVDANGKVQNVANYNDNIDGVTHRIQQSAK